MGSKSLNYNGNTITIPFAPNCSGDHLFSYVLVGEMRLITVPVFLVLGVLIIVMLVRNIVTYFGVKSARKNLNMAEDDNELFLVKSIGDESTVATITLTGNVVNLLGWLLALILYLVVLGTAIVFKARNVAKPIPGHTAGYE